MASELKVDKFTGVTTAGSILVTGEGNSTTTNLQQGLLKAWGNFDGSGTVGTNDSFNMDALTDNGTGNYDMNFDVDMANDDYASAGMHGQFAGSLAPLNLFVGTFNFRSNDDNAAATDDANITVMCFGDTA